MIEIFASPEYRLIVSPDQIPPVRTNLPDRKKTYVIFVLNKNNYLKFSNINDYKSIYLKQNALKNVRPAKLDQSPSDLTRMDTVRTFVQNGDIVDLDQNIGKMAPTAGFVTLVGSFNKLFSQSFGHFYW